MPPVRQSPHHWPTTTQSQPPLSHCHPSHCHPSHYRQKALTRIINSPPPPPAVSLQPPARSPPPPACGPAAASAAPALSPHISAVCAQREGEREMASNGGSEAARKRAREKFRWRDKQGWRSEGRMLRLAPRSHTNSGSEGAVRHAHTGPQEEPARSSRASARQREHSSSSSSLECSSRLQPQQPVNRTA